LLTEANWENASLEELVQLALDTKGTNADIISFNGPPILIAPKHAVSIAMVLHELCTNARKYGALCTDKGQVKVDWWTTDDARPQLWIRWQESGGPLVSPPRRRGFGSVLLERTLAHDLDGEVTINFKPEGLLCSMVFPLISAGELQ
jgi:two-component sensor histidine kinase